MAVFLEMLVDAVQAVALWMISPIFLLSALAIVVALLWWSCSDRGPKLETATVAPFERQLSGDFRDTPADEAEVYWSRGYGKNKYLGLHLDPLALSKPADYSLLPLPLVLPDLSPEQQDQLSELSARIADLTSEGSIRTDPSTLVRYLRARKWKAKQAELLLRKSAAYRKEHDINRCFSHWNLEAYEQCLGPWWLSGGVFGHGRKGEPIAIERLGRCFFSELITMLPFEELLKIDILHMQRCVAALEEDAMRRGTPLIPVVVVMDLAGVGWDQVNFNAGRAMGRLVENRSLTGTEITGKVLAVNAPSAAEKIWSMMKHLLDPGTAAKVEIVTPKNTLNMLLKYIDKEEIPAFLGGSKCIDGDPECRKVLAPGGLPPPRAMDRFKSLIANGGHLNSTDKSQNPTNRHSSNSALEDDGNFKEAPSWRFCCG